MDADPVPESPAGIAVAAAKAMNYGLAGVHLLENWTSSQWQVIDVSPAPFTSGGDLGEAYAHFLTGETRLNPSR